MGEQKFSPEFEAQKWKPGQSGNPKGRPKGATFEERVASVLGEAVPGTDQTKIDVLARVFVDELLKRNVALIRDYLAREWPAVQKHEHGFIEDPEEADLADSLASVSRRRRTNGSGRSVDASAEEDAGS